jgi:phosphoglycolate phosphatase
MLTRSDLDALVFDLDGTLIDSRIDFSLMRERTLAYLQERGLDTTPVAGELVLEMLAWGQRQLPPEEGDRYRLETRRILFEVEHHHAETAELFPGVREALEQAHESGLKLGIITRSSHPYADQILARHPLPITVLVTRDDLEVDQLKPRPEQLWLALQRLDATPARALMVGDHPTDLACGLAAGAHTAGVINGSRQEARLREAGAEILAADIPSLIRQILEA